MRVRFALVRRWLHRVSGHRGARHGTAAGFASIVVVAGFGVGVHPAARSASRPVQAAPASAPAARQAGATARSVPVDLLDHRFDALRQRVMRQTRTTERSHRARGSRYVIRRGTQPLSQPAPAAPAITPANASDLAQAQARWLRSAGPARDRARSRTSMRGLSRAEAIAVLKQTESEPLDATTSEPLDLDAGDRVVGFPTDFSAIIEHPTRNGPERMLVDSTVPVASSLQSGQPELVDPAMHDTGKSFAPANPAVPITVSKDPSEGVKLDGTGVSISASASSDAPALVDGAAIFPNSQPDTDLAVTAAPYGVELSWQLRSPASPEALPLRLSLPAGATITTRGLDGGAVIQRADGQAIAGIRPPVATDAQAQPVEASYRVEGNELVVRVAHAGEDLAYPITVDPMVDRFNMDDSGQVTGCSTDWGGWQFATTSVGFGWAGFCGVFITAQNAQSGGIGTWSYRAPRQAWIYRTDFGVSHNPSGSCVIEGIFSIAQNNWEANGYWQQPQPYNPQPPPTLTSPWWQAVGNQSAQNYRGNPCAALTTNGKAHFAPTPTGGNEARFQMWTPLGNGATQAMAGLMGVSVFLDDGQNPSWDTPLTHSDAHFGDWTRDRTETVRGTVRDAGLGIKFTGIMAQRDPASTATTPTGAEGLTLHMNPCTSGHGDWCPSPVADSFTYSTADVDPAAGAQPMPEGIDWVKLVASDPLFKGGDSGAWNLRVDRGAPAVTLGGSLWSARQGGSGDSTLHNEQYSLKIQATDGVASPATNAQHRSGVKDARLEIAEGSTWVTVSSWTNAIAGDNAKLGFGASLAPPVFDFRTDAYDEGVRNMRVVVTDRAGNATTVPFQVDVRRSPRSGSLPFYSLANDNLSDHSRLSVNTADGNLLVRNTDFQLAGIGFDLVIGRSYNSFYTARPSGTQTPPAQEGGYENEQDEFGPGWKLSLGESTFLQQLGSGDVQFYGPDGYRIRFAKNADGSYQRPKGVGAKLSGNSTSGWTMNWFRQGHKWTFDSAGKLQKIADRNDNTMTLDYDANGRVLKITNGLNASGGDRRHRVIDITGRNANGDITDIHDPQLDRTWHYTYDANGRLFTATDPIGNVTTYSYGPDGRLKQILDPRNATTTISYEPGVPRFARVISVQRPPDANNVRPATTFQWDDTETDNGSRVDKVLGPRNTSTFSEVTKYKSDDLDRISDVTDPLGGDDSRGYDNNGGDSLGTTAGVDVSFGYTNAGDDLASAAEGPVKTALSYGGPPNQPSASTDPNGNATNYGYDGKQNRSSLTVPGTAAGAPNQAAITFPRDTTGSGLVDKVETAIDPADPNGAKSTIDYEYTPEFELQKVIPDGRSDSSDSGVTRYTYDAASRVHTMTDGAGRTTTYGYDAMDRLTTLTYASGASVSYEYDANGNRTTVNDTRGRTTYSYDNLNRQLTETLNAALQHTYTWDLDGNMSTHVEGGQTTAYSYDARNLPQTVIDPAGKRTLLHYTLDDRLLDRELIEVDANGQNPVIEIDNDYDKSGRIRDIKATTPTTGDVLEHYHYGYDDATPDTDTTHGETGSLIQFVRDFALDHCTDYTYDGMNRLVDARKTNDADDCDFDRSIPAGQVEHWHYTYDGTSSLTKTEHDGDTTTIKTNERNEVCWTASGTPTNACDNQPAGADDYDYDDAGNLTRAGGRYQASYNERGQTNTVTPSGQSAIAQQYADTGQTQRTVSGSSSFLYNLLGIGQATQAAGAPNSPLPAGVTTYTRAANGQLISQHNPDGTTEYFLSDGHPGSVVALARADRVGTTNPVVTARFRYDPYGNVIRKDGSSDTNWRFAGGWFDRFPNSDPSAQAGLYKMGERYYDPKVGRWTQRDPIDQATSPTEGNGFMYAGGDPINGADPSGMFLGGVGDFVSDAGEVVGNAFEGANPLRIYSTFETAAVTAAFATGTFAFIAGCTGLTAGVATVACVGAVGVAGGGLTAGAGFAAANEAMDTWSQIRPGAS